MALTQAQRERAWSLWVRTAPDDSPVQFTKPELRAVANAIEQWLTTNQASFVSGLAGTAFAGNGSTTDQKVRALVAVAISKYDVQV